MSGEDVDPKSSASAAAVPYVFLLFLLDVMTQFLALVSALHMIGSTSYMQLHLVSVLDVFSSSSYMQMLFTFSLSHCMTCFISVGERSRNSKFSTHHQDQSMEFTSNEREGECIYIPL